MLARRLGRAGEALFSRSRSSWVSDLMLPRATTTPEHFDPLLIKQTIKAVGIRTAPAHVGRVLKVFGSDLLKRPAVKSVCVDPETPGLRVVLLEPTKFSAVQDVDQQLSNKQRELLEELGDTSVVTSDVHLDFRSFSTEEILASLLPADIAAVRSFEGIGHIAHLNLRDEHLPHKHLIGEVILAKNPGLRTVVSKVGNIKSQFRTFEMEVIAGDDDTEAIVGEGGFRFQLDFRKVYWNSRLGTEHHELATSFQLDDIVCK